VSQYHFDPATYLGLIRADVPAYDEFQDAVAEATSGLAAQRILELGVGTGETARRVLARHPDARLVGIVDADLRVGRLQDPLPEGPFDLVVSALAVHHLDPVGKRELFERVAASLAPGGRFVLGDVVVPARPEDAVTPLTEGFDMPDRLADILRWLRAAGFSAQPVWEHADLAIVRADLASRA
jgi:tRNA (cmo5U34)-methyltransferase